MKIINIAKIKGILIISTALVIITAALALFFGNKGEKKEQKEEDLVLQPAPYSILDTSLLFRTSENDIEYALNERGEIIFKDNNGRTYTIDSDGNVYEILQNGERELLKDDEKRNEILLSALEARESDPWIQSLLENKEALIEKLNRELMSKDELEKIDLEEYKSEIDKNIDKVYTELLTSLGKDMKREELKELISKKGLDDLEFLNLVKEQGPEAALKFLEENESKKEDKTKTEKGALPPQSQEDKSFLVSLQKPNNTHTNVEVNKNQGNSESSVPSFGSSLDTMALIDANRSRSSYEEQNRQADKLNFLNKNSEKEVKYTKTDSFTLVPGTIIPITLITELNSDLPGNLIAQASTNVYDSATGENILINKGERFIGTYDSALTYGQKRVLVVWDTLIKNDGTVIDIPSLVGVDNNGASGWTGKTNSHIGSIILSAGLSSLVNIGTEALETLTDSQILNTLLNSTARGSASVVESLISRQLNRQPTITIEKGKELNIIVTRPIRLGY